MDHPDVVEMGEEYAPVHGSVLLDLYCLAGSAYVDSGSAIMKKLRPYLVEVFGEHNIEALIASRDSRAALATEQTKESV